MTQTVYLPRSPAIDPRRWPDVADVPDAGIRARIADLLFRRNARRLPLRIELPDGSRYGGGAPTDPVMTLVRPGALMRRVSTSGTIGFGEGYLAGDWEARDLVGVLTAFASAVGNLVPLPLQRLRHNILSRVPSAERNTVSGSVRNISRHYDLSNDMFAAFLDETMTYSSALFAQTDGSVVPGTSLTEAQHRKIDRLLNLARVGPGTTLLEIGTGWGELALRAAARGADVHTVTISAEQADLARKRIAVAGLSDRVVVDLRDYRAVEGSYDAIISVEMIEAVGLDHIQEYFAALGKHLSPGGTVALQAITMPHDRMVVSQDTYTWMRKYIFPGGQILSLDAIRAGVRDHSGMAITAESSFGLHYAETLRQWRARFQAHDREIGELGFDDTFRRMWTYYLAYSEAGFRANYLDVYQLQLARPGRSS